MLRTEPGVDVQVRVERPDQQRRSDQQHHGNRELTRHEQRSRAVPPNDRAAGREGALERLQKICSGTLKSRQQPQRDADRQRNREREQEHASVHDDRRRSVADARDTRRIGAEDHRVSSGKDPQQRAHRRHTDHEPEGAAERRHHHGFREQLTHEAAAARAKRRANRELAPPARSASQEETGHVGTGDQQDEGDGEREHVERSAHVADHHLDEGAHLGRRLLARGGLTGEAGTVLRERRIGRADAGIGGVERDPGSESAGDDTQIAGVHATEIVLERHPRIGTHIELLTVESGGNHADDRARHPSEGDRLADDIRRSSETPGPQLITQDRDRSRARTILIERERPSLGQRDTKESEERGRDPRDRHMLRSRAAGDVGEFQPMGRHVFEQSRIACASSRTVAPTSLRSRVRR